MDEKETKAELLKLIYIFLFLSLSLSCLICVYLLTTCLVLLNNKGRGEDFRLVKHKLSKYTLHAC